MYNEPSNINENDYLESLKWAFEQGYLLGCEDIRQGVHIDFLETQKYFLDQISESQTSKTQLDCIGA